MDEQVYRCFCEVDCELKKSVVYTAGTAEGNCFIAPGTPFFRPMGKSVSSGVKKKPGLL